MTKAKDTFKYADPLLGYYSRNVFILIAVSFAVHMIVASVFQLGNDEAYYWFYAQHLQWNYFDHPPLVAVWSRIFSANLLLQDFEVFVRLGSVVGSAMATWFMYKAVTGLHSPKAGWYAAMLYNTCFYAAIVAGVFIMPDAPQMIFWTFCIWMFVKISKNENSWIYWILFGIAAGLCIMSKVHGAFLWIGLFLFCVFQKRSWLQMRQFYLSALLTGLVASPIILWNAANEFVTFNFHGERVNIIGWNINFKNFLLELVGQFLFNNPFNVVLTLLAIIAGKSMVRQIPALAFFKWTGLPLALILLFVSMFRPIFPHWSGPAYVSLIPIAAVYLAEHKRELLPSWIKWSLGGFFVYIIAWPLITYNFPGTWGSKEKNFGWSDVSLDRYGWREAGQEFARFYTQQLEGGEIQKNTPLVCNTWWGAHVEYYFARPIAALMIGLGPLHEIHHYMWMNNLRQKNANMQQAFCIVPSDEYYDVGKAYSDYYKKIEWLRTITVNRGGQKARSFYVYRLSGWKNNLPVWR